MKVLFYVCQFYCFWQHLPRKYTFVQQTASDVNGKFRSRLQWMLKSVTLNSGAYSKKKKKWIPMRLAQSLMDTRAAEDPLLRSRDCGLPAVGWAQTCVSSTLIYWAESVWMEEGHTTVDEPSEHHPGLRVFIWTLTRTSCVTVAWGFTQQPRFPHR